MNIKEESWFFLITSYLNIYEEVSQEQLVSEEVIRFFLPGSGIKEDCLGSLCI